MSIFPPSRCHPRRRNGLVIFLLLVFLTAAVTGCMAYDLDSEEADAPPPESESNPQPNLPQNNQNNDEENEEEELTEEELEEIRRLEEEARQAEEKEQRRILEAERREKLGMFYVPLPEERRDNPPVKARGLYVTGHSVSHPRYETLIDLVMTTELNSVVIDVKDDHGHVTYNSELEIVKELNSNRSHPIKDLKRVVDDLHEKGIYTIARVVVFKDPYLAEKRPEWSITRNTGGLWRDRKGVAWVDPYQRKVWDYTVAVSREAALAGFQEIQFDYVRFPENAHRVDQEAYYPAQDELEKDELIREFLIYAGEKLVDYDVFISADVFGVIATSWGDSDRIGQTWEKVSPYVDYICPMIYPSHYGPGYFGYSVPDAHPGGTIRRALIDSIKRNAPLDDPAIIRPWLQNFTASWIRGYIRYGPEQIREQIEEAQKLGIDEYLLWNANNRYQPDAFLTEKEASARLEETTRARIEQGLDATGVTPEKALEIFLESVRLRNWQEAFSRHITGPELDYKSYPTWKDSWNNRPVEYHVEPLKERDMAVEILNGKDGVLNLDLSLRLRGNDNEFDLSQERWEIKLENHIWRVKPSEKFIALLTREQESEETPN